jgi:outer membrane biosynthesis protein TonB
MATKKKAKKKKAPAKKAPKKLAPKKSAKKSPALKKPAKKKKTPAAKPRLASKKKSAPKKTRATRRSAATSDLTVDTAAFNRESPRARSGGQSGDLQGLSNREGANSESVDELLEEGNSFEADIVKGVEDAGDEGEVHTHEVPEDDVPGEYRDKDWQD